MIRFLNYKDKEMIAQAKALWIKAFGDDAAFTEYYFKERTRPEYILCNIEKGRIISMLHAIPRLLSLNGTEYPIRLITGVCTEEAYRCRGLAGELMEHAHESINADAFVLQPADKNLVKFYEKHGYVSLCEYDTMTIERDSNTYNEKAYSMPTAEHLLSIHKRVSSSFNSYTVMDTAQMKALIDEVRLGDMFIAYTGNEYAVCTIGESECRAIACSCCASDELLRAVFSCTKQDKIRFILPRFTADAEHIVFNMIHIKKESVLNSAKLQFTYSHLSY